MLTSWSQADGQKLSIADWATPRDEFDFVFLFPPLTYIVNVRQGVYPPEVIKEHGDADDWENLFGTGPYMLTDVVEGSSVTWDRNPDYWGTDENTRRTDCLISTS